MHSSKISSCQITFSCDFLKSPDSSFQKTGTPADEDDTKFDVLNLNPTLTKKIGYNGEWGIFFHKELGRFYYTNLEGKSTWQRPDEILIDDERRALIRDFLETEMERGEAPDNKIGIKCLEYLQNLKPKSYLGGFIENLSVDYLKSLISRCCVEYFILLLDEKMMEQDEAKKLKPTMSWESVSKLLNADRRFHLISRPSEKKALFNKWKLTAYEREKRTKDANFEAFCKKFTENMSAHKSFNSNLTFSAATELFSAENFWSSTPENDRKSVFEEVMKRIQKRIEKEEEQYRKENIQLLANILKDMQSINCETTWAQAQRLLAANNNFQANSSLMNMDKEDALCVFTTHVRGLIEEYRDMRSRNKITQSRKERKVRERFQELLIELRRRDIITLKTKWKDISPLICKEDRFLELLTQSGPTPIDFFKFYMIDWNTEFKNNLNFVMDVMEDENFDFSLTTTIEAFTAFIDTHTKSGTLNKENYQYIYDHLLRQLIEKTSKQDNAMEKLREIILTHLKKLEIPNINVDIRDIEAVTRYFKARWNINENVESMILKVREEYLGQEEGEITQSQETKAKNSSPLSSTHSNSPSYTSTKKKHKKEKKNRKRSHHSSEREQSDKSKKKKHRRRSSSVEDYDDRRNRGKSPNHHNYKNSRRH